MRITGLRSAIIAAAAALVLGISCGESVRTGPLKEESRSVELGDAKSVRVSLRMAAGELSVEGGADDLMEGQFTYNVREWEPAIEYRIRGDRGNLSVEQPTLGSLGLSHRVRNQWDLRFSDAVPMDMDIELGAGRNRLSLGSLRLSKLDIRTGAGEVDVGLVGSESLKILFVQTGAGDVTVDLTGDWMRDLEAKIEGGIGRVTLRLPSKVGVRVDADQAIGKISTKGLKRRGKVYVNDAYDTSDVTLYIATQAGIGKINLVVGY